MCLFGLLPCRIIFFAMLLRVLRALLAARAAIETYPNTAIIDDEIRVITSNLLPECREPAHHLKEGEVRKESSLGIIGRSACYLFCLPRL